MERKNRWTWALFVIFCVVLVGCDLVEPVPPTPPTSAPTVDASTGTHPTSIELSWNPVEGADNYRLFRAEDEAGTYTYLGETPYTSYYDDVGSANTGKWYWYRVRACNAAGCGPESAPVRGYAGKPPAPTDVRASDGEYRDFILITWEPVPGATGYVVYRDRARDGTYRTVVADRVKGPPVADEDVRFGAKYWYRVQARNRYGFGPLSEPDSGCTPPCLPTSAGEEEP